MYMQRSLLKASASPVAFGGFRLPDPWSCINAATTLKSKIASRYDEAISYALPGRDGLTAGPDQSEIYDDTAVHAVGEFASRLQQGVIPNFSRWASYIAGIMIDNPDELDAIGKQLEIVDNYLFDLINTSNFQTEAHEAFIDLALGTAGVSIRPSAANNNPFICRVIPLRGLKFGIGPDGQPDPIFEERMVVPNQLKVLWPDAVFDEDIKVLDPNVEVKVVEAWQRDWSRMDDIYYKQTVYVPDCGDCPIVTKWHQGEGCCEIIVFRWTKTAGEAWGRGPLFNLLPSLRKVNYAERALMDHVDMSLGGIWSIEDDGVINTDTVTLEPGTLVPRAAGSQPLQNVVPQGDFHMAEFALNEARANIKAALFTDQLGNPNKTPMSAAEVNQRMAELARAIGSPFGRIIMEFVLPAVVRFTRICKDRGLIKMPKVNGKDIRLICTSPLAQAQRFEDIDNIDRFLGTIGARLGQEMLNVVVDGGNTASVLADRFRVPKTILRPPAQQKQIIQAITQAQQQQQAPSDAGQDAQAGGGAPAPAPG